MVDFDNVYSGLRKLDPEAAESFARTPLLWTEALVQSGIRGETRRFLIRNCYMNPSVYSHYRAFWTRAGFRVVDCPSLTQQGKSSADINLVLDAVDILSGPVDEFFIVSADADFTSLIARFRAADRLTTVIVAGEVASAYRHMADSIVNADGFIAILNGRETLSQVIEPQPIVDVQAQSPVIPPQESLVIFEQPSAAAMAVLDYLKAAKGPVKVPLLAHRARHGGLSIAADWDGFGTFRSWLTQFPEVGSSFDAKGEWAWDAARFSDEDLPEAAGGQPPIIAQVTQVTEVPGLSKEQFKMIFTFLATELINGTQSRSELSKQVRDACTEAGQGVSRSAVNFVIGGLLFANALKESATAEDLALGWTRNVESLCGGARMEFSPHELMELRKWVSGGYWSEAV